MWQILAGQVGPSSGNINSLERREKEREREKVSLVTGAAQRLGGVWPLTPCQPGDWLRAQALGTVHRDL